MDWMALAQWAATYVIPAVLALLGWTNRKEIAALASKAAGKVTGDSSVADPTDQRRRVFDAVVTIQRDAVACGACPDKIDGMKLSEISDLATNFKPAEATEVENAK